MSLPAETELVRNLLAGQSFLIGQGLFQTGVQAFAELESEVRIAQQLAQAIVDDATQKFLELILGKLGEIHTGGGYGGACLKCNHRTVVY